MLCGKNKVQFLTTQLRFQNRTQSKIKHKQIRGETVSLERIVHFKERKLPLEKKPFFFFFFFFFF
jgi:hypothetical protein